MPVAGSVEIFWPPAISKLKVGTLPVGARGLRLFLPLAAA